MCGFIFYPNKPSKKDLLKHLRLQKHRGTDGFGAMHVTTGRVVRASTASKFAAKVVAQLPKRGGIVVHHRKASIGGVKNMLIHPLTDQDKVVKVFQNGTKKSLAEAFNTDSDTQAIAQLWAALDTPRDEKMLEELLDGAGVVVCQHNGQTYMAHDGARILHYCASGEMAGCYSSEPLVKGTWHKVMAFTGIARMGATDINEWHKFFPLEEAKEYTSTCSFCRERPAVADVKYVKYVECVHCEQEALLNEYYGGKTNKHYKAPPYSGSTAAYPYNKSLNGVVAENNAANCVDGNTNNLPRYFKQ